MPWASSEVNFANPMKSRQRMSPQRATLNPTCSRFAVVRTLSAWYTGAPSMIILPLGNAPVWICFTMSGNWNLAERACRCRNFRFRRQVTDATAQQEIERQLSRTKYKHEQRSEQECVRVGVVELPGIGKDCRQRLPVGSHIRNDHVHA